MAGGILQCCKKGKTHLRHKRMSSERFQKRRCIIKKLDFENCIVTNSKTTARGRKKLRARITREVEDVLKDDLLDASSSASPQKSQTSPVLLVRNPLGDGESPAFSKRRKLNFSWEEEEDTEKSFIEPCSPSSPVFKLLKRSRVFNESRSSAGGLLGEEDSSSCMESSYQIEDSTTQESKDSVKISSVDSAEMKSGSLSICSIGSNALTCGEDVRDSPGQLSTTGIGAPERSDSKRSHRKCRLLSRLHKLQKKQASEKLLWQHQHRRNSVSTVKFSVVTFWKDEFNFFLKCNSSPSNPSVTFLVVDSRWVPNLRRVRVASVLRLHPPWQKVTLEESNTTVLTNVICLDILDEMEEPIVEKRVLERVPAEQFEIRENLFVDSLFCSTTCGFFC